MLHAIILLAAVADQTAQNRIDLSPLIPVINGLITALAGVLTIATPILAYYLIVWLRNHGIAMSAQAQAALVKQADGVIAHGVAYSQATADVGINNLKVASPSDTVTKAASYVIAQAPDLLAKLGFDPRTEAGQQAIVRMVTARLIPAPTPADTTVDVNLKAAPAAPETTAKENKQ